MKTTPMEIGIVNNDYDLRFMASNRIVVRQLIESYLSENLADFFPLSVGEIVFTGIGWSQNTDTVWVDYTDDGEPHEYGFDVIYSSFDAVIE